MDHKITPKDFFLWLGAVIALYGSVVSLIALLFQYIDFAFPDPLSYYYSDPFSGGIRFAMASLIVLVPLMLILMRVIRKDIQRHPVKAEIWVRRWALYLTVFLAGAVVIGDLITLVNYFLGGDLTTRFLLKVLALLLIAGGVFMHFLADLWGYWVKNPSYARMIGWGAGLVVVASIVSGFLIMGTPGQVRLMRYDSQKVSDLQNIQWQIVNHWQIKEALPANLSELEDPLSGWKNPVDPQTNEPYAYRRVSPRSFELCAGFNTVSEADRMQPMTSRTYPMEFADENWDHPAGEKCFQRTIDPDRYPPYPKDRTI